MSVLPSLFEKDDISVDAALAALPFDDGSFAKLAAVEENMDRHGKSHPPHADVNPPVPALIFWHFVQKARQYFVQIVHSLRSNTSERFGIEGCRRGNCNGLTPPSAGNHFHFRPTVAA